MLLPKPITRTDYYLSKITGEYRGNTPYPIQRKDFYLAKIAGDYSGTLPPPIDSIDFYLSKISGDYSGPVPEPISRIDYFLAAISGDYDGILPEPITRQEIYLAAIAGQHEYITKFSEGEVITIYNAIEREFDGLRIFGRSEQREYTGVNILGIFADSTIFSVSFGLRCLYLPSKMLVSFDGVANSDLKDSRIYLKIKLNNLVIGDTYAAVLDNPSIVYDFRYTNTTDDMEHGFSNTIKPTEEMKDILFTVIVNNTTFKAGDEVHEATHVMLYKVTDSKRPAIEPYTGAKPSPNPDYPQDIISAGAPVNLLDGVNFYSGWITYETGEITNAHSNYPNAIYSDPIPLVEGMFYSFTTTVTPYIHRIRTFNKEGVLVNPDKKLENNVIEKNETYCRVLYLDGTDESISSNVFRKIDTSITVQQSGGNLFDITKAVINVPVSQPNLKVEIEGNRWKINGSVIANNHYQNISTTEIKLTNGLYRVIHLNTDRSEAIYSEVSVSDVQGKYFYNRNTLLNITDDIINVRVRLTININSEATYNNFYASVQIFRETTPYPPDIYKDIKSLIYQTPNGLPGIKIDDSFLPYYTPNYTDKNGVNWCCDEIDFARGVYIARLDMKQIILHKEVNSRYYNGYRYITDMTVYDFSNALLEKNAIMLSSKFKHNNNAGMTNSTISHPGIRINREYNMAIAELYDTPINEAPAAIETEIIYAITPIETPLSQEIIAKFQEFMLYGDVTQVYNDADAWMEVGYKARPVSEYRERGENEDK